MCRASIILQGLTDSVVIVLFETYDQKTSSCRRCYVPFADDVVVRVDTANRRGSVAYVSDHTMDSVAPSTHSHPSDCPPRCA